MVNKQGLTILIVGMCLAHLLVGVGHSQTQVNADIRESTVWTLAGSPYLIERDVTVRSGADLTIQPGVRVALRPGASLIIGRSSSGSLKALGTASQPIRFTSAQTSPYSGDWGSLRFDYSTDSAKTVIEHCVIEYGGAGREAAIEIIDSSPTIQNVEVSESSTNGMSIKKTSNAFGGPANPIIMSSRFKKNFLSGLIIHNSLNQSSAVIKHNIFERNGYYPIVCNANTVGNIQQNVFTDNRNEAILVAGATVRTSARIFNLGIPFIVSSEPIVIGASQELFIDPGVVLSFNSGTGIVSRDGGALRALGESHNPIMFTSNQESPSRGDWQGIYIYDRTISSSLEFCIIEYGGQGGNGNVYIRRGSPTITNCVIRQSSNDGVIIYRNSDANPVISQNSIYENARFGINNESTRQVTARNNWWGSAGGAQSIEGGVDTASHLLSPILIGFPRSPWLQLFPHFAAGLGWKSFLFLQNVEEIDTSVDVSFYGGDGLPEQVTIAAVTGTEFSVEVPRQGSKSLEITSGRLASGWIELFPRQKVNSSLVFQFEAEGAVAATAGVPAAQLGEEFRITFRSSAATGNRVGVALANPNNDPIRVRMELFRSSGQFFSGDDLELPAWGHLASFVDELFPAAAAWDGYVKLSSDLGFIVVPLKIDGSLISTIAASKIR